VLTAVVSSHAGAPACRVAPRRAIGVTSCTSIEPLESPTSCDSLLAGTICGAVSAVRATTCRGQDGADAPKGKQLMVPMRAGNEPRPSICSHCRSLITGCRLKNIALRYTTIVARAIRIPCFGTLGYGAAVAWV